MERVWCAGKMGEVLIAGGTLFVVDSVCEGERGLRKTGSALCMGVCWEMV